MISELFTDEFFEKAKKRPYGRMLYPPASDREYWEKTAQGFYQKTVVNKLIPEAEKLLDAPIPQTRFSDYMRYIQDGDRTTYEQCNFRKRQELGILTMAYVVTCRPIYLNAIIDRIGSILEETFWCVPAHNSYPADDPFPELAAATKVDLFAAVTARLLAECYNLIGEDLEKISPNLVRLLRERTLERTVYPVMTNDQWNLWWLEGTNNWSIWCSRNILAAGMILLDHAPDFFRLTRKLNLTADKFIAHTPDDGFCDEGPSYWNVAGGALFMYLDVLDAAFPHSVDSLFEHPKIRNIGEYCNRVVLCDSYVFNYADGKAKVQPYAGMTYYIGERIHSTRMCRRITELLRAEPPLESVFFQRVCGAGLTFGLLDFCKIPLELPDFASTEPEKMTRLEKGQSVIFRTAELTASIKGGSNGESHNHNDLGHVTIIFRHHPIIVDIGTEIYTRRHFDPETRWNFRHINALGHNAAIIDSIRQTVGGEYVATLKNSSESELEAEMDLSHAYPAEAKIKRYTRTLQLSCDHQQGVITDDFDCEHQVDYYFYTPQTLTQKSDTELRLGDFMTLRLEHLKIMELETLPLKDPIQREDWGNELHCIHLAGQGKHFVLNFSV